MPLTTTPVVFGTAGPGMDGADELPRGWDAVRKPLATGALLGVCCVGLAAWNPGDHGIPLCPTKLLTGYDCPFCGGLRAVASLTRGHPMLAADHNLVVAVLAPLAVAWWCWWVVRSWRGEAPPPTRLPRAATIAVAITLVVFTVVRNLPVGGFPHWLNSSTS